MLTIDPMTDEVDDSALIADLSGGLFNDPAPTGDMIPDDESQVQPQPTPEPEPEPQPAPAEPAAVAPVEQPAPAAEPSPTPAPAAATEPTPEPAPQLPKNGFRVKAGDERTAEVLRVLQSSHGELSIDEAMALVDGRADANKPDPNEPPAPGSIAAMEKEIADLDAVIKKAGEDESYLTADLAAAIQKRSDLAADVRVQKLRAEQEAERQAEVEAAQYGEKFTADLQTAITTAETEFEALKDLNSPLSIALESALDAVVAKGSNHDLFKNPEAPLILARQLAKRMNIAPKSGPAPTPTQPPAAAAPAATPAPAQPAPTAPAPRPLSGLPPAPGASRTAPQAPDSTPSEADWRGALSKATSDNEAAGLLAAELFAGEPKKNDFVID